MDYHFDYELRLNTNTQYKSLYTWAINEIDSEGNIISKDQIPWDWTIYFSATSCTLTNRLEIERPFSLHDQKDEPPQIGVGQVIRLTLRPGRPANSRGNDEVNFSMFGTKRPLKDFVLEIRPLDDPEKLENCSTWGCVSYTSEVDFRTETSDDCLWFYLFVRPKTFARYVAMIDQNAISNIVFGAGLVDGFYSDWSPAVSTSKVKVLTRDREHKLELPPDFQGEPPRLGRVQEARLYINRKIEFQTSPTAVPESNDWEENAPKAAVHAGPQGTPPIDPRVLQHLSSLRRAAWVAVNILAIIMIGVLFK